LMKRNLIQSIPLILDLKGGVLCVDYNTGTKSSVSKFKLDPIKFTVNWYLKANYWHQVLISLLPKKAFMMLSLLKHSRYRNDCGYNPTSFSKSSPAIANIEVSDSFADIINTQQLPF
jgi:hypothetical protein